MIGDSAQSIRLPGTEQRYPVADQFTVVHYTNPADGTQPKRYGYRVVIVSARDMVLECSPIERHPEHPEWVRFKA